MAPQGRGAVYTLSMCAEEQRRAHKAAAAACSWPTLCESTGSWVAGKLEDQAACSTEKLSERLQVLMVPVYFAGRAQGRLWGLMHHVVRVDWPRRSRDKWSPTMTAISRRSSSSINPASPQSKYRHASTRGSRSAAALDVAPAARRHVKCMLDFAIMH